MLSIPERIAQCAEQIATDDSMGYSQPNRAGSGSKVIKFSDGTTYTIKGGDLDCSEMVRRCVNAALGKEAISFLWTGDEHAKLTTQGFERMSYGASKVRRGDVLWVSGHTGIALGGGYQADAHGDEYGGLTGPTKGDQTGHEVEKRALRSWAYIYRYQGGEDVSDKRIAATFDWQFDRTVRVRTAPSTSATAMSATWGKGDTMHADGFWVAEGIVWGTYVGPTTGKRLYAAMAQNGTQYGGFA